MKRLLLCIIGMAAWAAAPAFAQGNVQKGTAAYRNKDYAQAITLLRAEIAAAPGSREAQYYLGLALWRVGKVDSAQIHLEKARSLDPSNPDYTYSLGSLYLEKKLYPEAERVFRAGLASKSKAFKARFNYGIGEVQLAAGSPDSALVYLIRAREEDPKDALIYAALGDTYAKQNIAALAIDNYSTAVQLDTTLAQVQYDLGKLLFDERRYNDALAHFRKAASIDPRFSGAFCETGNLFYLGRRYAEAIAEIKRCLELSPNSLEANMLMARALAANRQPGEALQYAKKAASIDTSSVEAARVLAQVAHAAGDDAEAVLAYRRLSQEGTLTAEEYMNFGRSYAALKKNSAAISMLEKAQAMDSTLGLYSEIGTLLYLEQRYPEAIASYDRQIAHDPKSASAYLNRGISYLRLGKMPDAIMSLRRGVELEPDNAQGHLWLAQCYATLDSVQQAKRQYEAVSRLDSTNAEALRYIGFTHLIGKDYAGAVPILEKALRLDPNSLQGRLWMAQAYALNRQKEKAIAEYHKVLKLDPHNADAEKGLRLLE
jgi:tetratricopeptide (TPR) repeat protein